MTYRIVKDKLYVDNFDAVRKLYYSLGNERIIVDESDLVVFRLMGATFEYSIVTFEDFTQVGEQVVSGAF